MSTTVVAEQFEPTASDATSGRGLALLDATGMRPGVERHGTGTTVWAEVDLPRTR